MDSNQPNSFWKVLFPNSNCWHSWFVLKTAVHTIWGVCNEGIFKSGLHWHLAVPVPLTNSNIYPKELFSTTSTVLTIKFLQELRDHSAELSLSFYRSSVLYTFKAG